MFKQIWLSIIRRYFYLELLINWRPSKMSLMQMDGTSRKRKAANMGEVCLPFFPCGLVLRTEKTKHCSEQSGKILQKWVRSSYNTDCSMENDFAFFTYSFHIYDWVSQWHNTMLLVQDLSTNSDIFIPGWLFHSCWSAHSSMVKPSSFIPFSLSCTPIFPSLKPFFPLLLPLLIPF